MADASAELPAEDKPGRQAVRVRTRVRLKRPQESLGTRAKKWYQRHRAWLVPTALFLLGTVGIWFALKFFVPREG